MMTDLQIDHGKTAGDLARLASKRERWEWKCDYCKSEGMSIHPKKVCRCGRLLTPQKVKF